MYNLLCKMVSISYLFHEHNEFAHLVDHFEQNYQFSKMSSNFVHIYEHCHFNLRILFFPFYMSTSSAHVKKRMLKSWLLKVLIGTLFDSLQMIFVSDYEVLFASINRVECRI